MRSQDVLRALRGILVTAAIGCSGALVGGIFFDDGPARVLGVTTLLGLPGVWWLVRRGEATRATLCLLGLFNAVTLYAVIYGGGVQDPTAMLFPVMIIASGMLLDRRLALGSSAVLVVSCVGVGVAELFGLIHTNLTHELSTSDVVFQAILIVAVAALVALMSRALRDSSRRALLTHQSYEEIFNATGEGILVHDPSDGRVLEVNDAALAMIGYERSDAAAFGLDALVGPEDFRREAFERELARAGRAPSRFEWCVLDRDGCPVWLDVTVRAAAIQGHDRVVSVLHDISERRALQQQVQQAEKLRAVGQLARGVAHDFNNQLTVILANAGLLEAGLRGDPELTEYTQAIIDSSRRSADLTHQLLAFARKGQRRDERVDLDALVADVKVLLERSIDKRIEVVHQASARPAVTRGDPTFLQSALLNLGFNARDAMPDGGTLRFVVEARDDEGSVSLRVEDTGDGMPESVQDHVFEPFYTTKDEGNGMGLAAVYGTVVSHEGSIQLESAPGRGTCFTIVLPAAAGEHPENENDPRAEAPPSFEGVRVLLAEDEPSVARVATRILRRLGCEVTHCEDGEAALACLEQEGDYDVALLDQSMPRTTGPEVLAAMRDGGVETPVIAMSGYTEASESPRHRPDAFVPKPFTPAALADALRTVLKRDT